MPNLATWIRECDEGYFQKFFDEEPDVKIFNARRNLADMSAMDGLLLTGGPDISSHYLAQEIPDPSLIKEPDPTRDSWEFENLRKALEMGKPIFAICKGMQVLNVAMGGTLHLDISNHDLPEMKLGNIQLLRHSSRAAHCFEAVNSSHHQAVDRLGNNLEIEAWCAKDDIVEQVKISNYPFGLAVQYHPERDSLYTSLFVDFFKHVKSSR